METKMEKLSKRIEVILVEAIKEGGWKLSDLHRVLQEVKFRLNERNF